MASASSAIIDPKTAEKAGQQIAHQWHIAEAESSAILWLWELARDIRELGLTRDIPGASLGDWRWREPSKAPAGRNRHHVDRLRAGISAGPALITYDELASHGQALLTTFESTLAAENLVFWLETQLRLPSGYAEFRAVVREVGAEIVAIDPFLEFFEGESSDKAEQVGKLFASLDRLMRDEPTIEGVIVAHHSNVQEKRTSGSWKFEGWPSTILRLEKVPGVPTDRMLCFEKIRAPGFGLPEKLQIRLSDAGYLPIADEDTSRTAAETVVVMILREAGGQLRRQELVERVQQRGSVKLRAAVGYVGKAKQAGLIEAFQDGREVIYRITETAS